MLHCARATSQGVILGERNVSIFQWRARGTDVRVDVSRKREMNTAAQRRNEITGNIALTAIDTSSNVIVASSIPTRLLLSGWGSSVSSFEFGVRGVCRIDDGCGEIAFASARLRRPTRTS